MRAEYGATLTRCHQHSADPTSTIQCRQHCTHITAWHPTTSHQTIAVTTTADKQSSQPSHSRHSSNQRINRAARHSTNLSHGRLLVHSCAFFRNRQLDTAEARLASAIPSLVPPLALDHNRHFTHHESTEQPSLSESAATLHRLHLTSSHRLPTLAASPSFYSSHYPTPR